MIDGRRDSRTLLLGGAAWAGALVGLDRTPGRWLGIAAACVVVLLCLRSRAALVGVLLAAVAGCGIAQGRSETVRQSPVRALASEGAAVRTTLVVKTDAERRQSRFGPEVRYRAELRELAGRGRRYRLSASIVVVADARTSVVPGARLRVAGTLAPSDRPDVTAVLRSRGPPELIGGPDAWQRAVNRVRRAVRAAAAGLEPGAAALVPALVDGDESASGGTGRFAEDFRAAGMTHLLAVSGTNLTLILGGLLTLAAAAGVRARALFGVGVVGVVGFVCLAGPEPSVLRAAVMGTIGLVGIGRGGPGRGLRILGAAVLVLVLLDPFLAVSIGFALSVAATAGILLLGPRWREALARWAPGWLAEAVAVPLAAQVACTPLVAAISGQVSLVAVPANLIVAPLVGPATVFGLAGGLVAVVSVRVGQAVALPAGWCGQAIIAVAHRSAQTSNPGIVWGGSVVEIAVLTVLCLLAARHLHRALARRSAAVGLAGALATTILVPLPTPGWPPAGWVLVSCAVGQGDGLVLRAGAHAAVVVDAGPDPRLIDTCLRALDITEVPVVVLTHFHADHVDGLPGVLSGRRVGRIDVSPLAEPEGGAAAVARAAAAGPEIRTVVLGERTSVGDLRWQVLGPARLHPESDSPPNDASVVLLVESRGLRLLLMGDEERPSQADLRTRWPGLRADVLKVAHHGSSKQDTDLIEGLGARLAVISVGADNRYGHPAPSTLDLLGRAGLRVLRTDREGDIAVGVTGAGDLTWAVRGNGGAAP